FRSAYMVTSNFGRPFSSSRRFSRVRSAIALQTARHASVGVMPLSMYRTTENAPQTWITDSPRPVEPAEPMLLSQYIPAPTIGESPRRPAIFHDSPLVLVHAAIVPSAVSAETWIVPVV